MNGENSLGRLQVTHQIWAFGAQNQEPQGTATIQEKVASVLLARIANRTFPMPCFNKRIDLLRMLWCCVVTLYWNSYPFILTEPLTSILRNNTAGKPNRK